MPRWKFKKKKVKRSQRYQQKERTVFANQLRLKPLSTSQYLFCPKIAVKPVEYQMSLILLQFLSKRTRDSPWLICKSTGPFESTEQVALLQSVLRMVLYIRRTRKWEILNTFRQRLPFFNSVRKARFEATYFALDSRPSTYGFANKVFNNYDWIKSSKLLGL